MHNSVMELRNICNHPYLSQLHAEEACSLPVHFKFLFAHVKDAEREKEAIFIITLCSQDKLLCLIASCRLIPIYQSIICHQL